jgi:hypothetical protein
MTQPNKNTRTVLFEVPVKATGATEISLYTDNEIKESKKIIKIEAYSNSQVPFSPNKATVISDAVLKKSSIIIATIDGTQVRHLALPSISKQANTLFIEEINVEKIGLEKCKILVGEPAGVTVGEVFLFAITYEK